MTLVEAEVNKIKTDIVVDKDDEEALGLEADEGEKLTGIVQKILLATKYKEENQRNKIFRTPGTINDKMCNVILNSVSNENTVSKAFVDW